jgi:hypothetical protein
MTAQTRFDLSAHQETVESAEMGILLSHLPRDAVLLPGVPYAMPASVSGFAAVSPADIQDDQDSSCVVV